MLHGAKKIYWIILSLFTIIVFVGLPFYVGAALLKIPSAFMPLLSITLVIVFPIVVMSSVLLFVPLLIKQKILVGTVAGMMMALSHVFVASIVPIAYIFPQLIFLLLFYATVFFLSLSVILPLGIRLSNIIKNWFIHYNTPQDLSDFKKDAEQNIATAIETRTMRFSARLVLLAVVIITVVISGYFPSIWGLGIFELKYTFPNESTFQTSIQHKFFTEQLPIKYTVQNFTRTPTISQCWKDLPSDVTNNYWLHKQVGHELTITDRYTSKPFYIATIVSACDLETETLHEKQIEDVTEYRYTNAYFNIKYSGQSTLLQDPKNHSYPSGDLLNINDSINIDKQRLWLRKDNTLLCVQLQNEAQKSEYISFLKSFKTAKLDTSKCNPTVVYKSNATPGKLVIHLKWELPDEQMQEILNDLGVSTCEKRWEGKPLSFLCTVPIGNEDEIMQTVHLNPNVTGVSRWYGD